MSESGHESDCQKNAISEGDPAIEPTAEYPQHRPLRDGSDLDPTVARSGSTKDGRTGSSSAQVSVPGYEIEGTLGRGGMGVVYRARDLKLKRPVALKMILGAEHAESEQIDRFRKEAETVARPPLPHCQPPGTRLRVADGLSTRWRPATVARKKR